MAEELETEETEDVEVLVLTRVTVQKSGPAETSVRDYAVAFVREALYQAVEGETAVGIPDPLGAVSADAVTTEDDPPAARVYDLAAVLAEMPEDGAAAVGQHLHESIRLGGSEESDETTAADALDSLLVHAAYAAQHLDAIRKGRARA